MSEFLYDTSTDHAVSAVSACAREDGTCSLGSGDSCKEAFDKGEERGDDWFKEAYWIFRAAEGVHAKIGDLKQKLRDKTISTSLQIEKMAEDFETTIDEDIFSVGDMPQWITAILSVLGVPSTGSELIDKLSPHMDLSPGKASVLGMLGTALDYIPKAEDDENQGKVSLSKIKSSLGDLFDDSLEGLDRTLRAAMGRSWADHQDDYNRLPSLVSDGNEEEEAVANFYNNPLWLLDGDSQAIYEILMDAAKIIEIHVVDTILKDLGYVVMWDSSIEQESECNGNGYRWMNVGDRDRCFTMYAKDGNFWSATPKDSELYAKMEKYGIKSLEAYYRGSVDCARVGCDMEQKVGAGELQNGVPLCFYSAPVMKKEIELNEDDCGNASGQIQAGCRSKTHYSDFFEEGSKTSCPGKTNSVIGGVARIGGSIGSS